MSAEEVIRKQVDAFNKHDVAGFASAYSQDAVVYDPYYPEPLRGREAIEKDMIDFFRAFPDVHNAISTTLENGNNLAVEFSVSGTHKGPLALPTGEVPATGKSFTFNGGLFSRLNSNGEIVEERRYFDVAGQMQQLGLSE